MKRRRAGRPEAAPETTAASGRNTAVEPNGRILWPGSTSAREAARRPRIPDTFLYCVRDADGRLSAGLKPAAGPASDAAADSDWNEGVVLTDVCDELMVEVVVAGRGGDDDDRRTALLGIAWDRATRFVQGPIRCWKPADLRPYTVRMRPGGDAGESETVVEVLAGSETAACAAAADAVFDRARQLAG